MKWKNQFQNLLSNSTVPLHYDDVLTHAAAPDFELYDRLLNHRAIEAMEHFRWCARPGCGSRKLHEDGDVNPIMTCVRADCSAKMCFAHCVPWQVLTNLHCIILN